MDGHTGYHTIRISRLGPLKCTYIGQSSISLALSQENEFEKCSLIALFKCIMQFRCSYRLDS